MERYDIEVLNGDKTIAAERSVALHSSKAAWPRIAKLAKTIDAPRCRIRVVDQSGETIILLGVATARRYPDIGLAV
jgi:hypothetical protein